MQTEKEYTVLLKYLIPRKGTETYLHKNYSLIYQKHLIPRKGTETRRNSQRTLQGIYKTIYTPQGDGNTAMSRILI